MRPDVRLHVYVALPWPYSTTTGLGVKERKLNTPVRSRGPSLKFDVLELKLKLEH